MEKNIIMATKKEHFIEEISELIRCEPDLLSTEALAYFEVLKTEPAKKSVEITENGAKILKFMQENWEKHNNIFKATTIAEGLFTNGKSVSGSMRKLVSDGYVDKLGKDPVIYAITEKGKYYLLT